MKARTFLLFFCFSSVFFLTQAAQLKPDVEPPYLETDEFEADPQFPHDFLFQSALSDMEQKKKEEDAERHHDERRLSRKLRNMAKNLRKEKREGSHGSSSSEKTQVTDHSESSSSRSETERKLAASKVVKLALEERRKVRVKPSKLQANMAIHAVRTFKFDQDPMNHFDYRLGRHEKELEVLRKQMRRVAFLKAWLDRDEAIQTIAAQGHFPLGLAEIIYNYAIPQEHEISLAEYFRTEKYKKQNPTVLVPRKPAALPLNPSHLELRPAISPVFGGRKVATDARIAQAMLNLDALVRDASPKKDEHKNESHANAGAVIMPGMVPDEEDLVSKVGVPSLPPRPLSIHISDAPLPQAPPTTAANTPFSPGEITMQEFLRESPITPALVGSDQPLPTMSLAGPAREAMEPLADISLAGILPQRKTSNCPCQ